MSDLPECTCPSLDSMLRLGLEGHTVPACEIHRPDARDTTASDALALNSDDLSNSLAARLGGASITNTL